MYLSPLRYPGGKAKMAPLLRDIIVAQPRRPTIYAEPFAGGAGAAMQLLSEGTVDRVVLNDLNLGIAAFWESVFNATERLVTAIRTADLTLENWYRQREVYLDQRSERFDRGFATFFLNRTNRSGILGARPIGGLEQTGTWKIDARFNREKLASRIEYLATFRDRVDVRQMDGRAFLNAVDAKPREVLFYVDPPYLRQGEDLYLSNMTYRDHVNLASTLLRHESPWVLTYDRDDRIPDELYAGLACASFSISHTAAKQRLGNEYLVVPKHVQVKALDGFGPRAGVWLDGRSPDDLAG